MSNDEQIEELKRLIEEEKEIRRAPSRKFRKKAKSDPVLRARITAQMRMYRQNPEVKKRENDKNIIYKKQRMIRDAGRPKPSMCEVCNRGGRIVFDHCHNTKQFRGWICHNCNVVLGLVDDDITTLEKLVVYLRAYSHVEQDK